MTVFSKQAQGALKTFHMSKIDVLKAAAIERYYQPVTLATRLGLSRSSIEAEISRYAGGDPNGLGPVERPSVAVVLIPEWAVNRWLGKEDKSAPIEEHLQLKSCAERLDLSVDVIRAAIVRWEKSPPQRREGLGPVSKLGPKTVLIPASAIRAWLARGRITPPPSRLHSN